MKRVPLLLSLLMLAACSSCDPLLPHDPVPPGPEPPYPPDWWDKQPVPSDCGVFCERVETLNCKAAWGIDPEDGSCADFCSHALDRGDFCPAAGRGALDCDQLDERVSCEGR